MDLAFVVGYVIGLFICYFVGNGVARMLNNMWDLDLNPITQGLIAVILGMFIGPIITFMYACYLKYNK